MANSTREFAVIPPNLALVWAIPLLSGLAAVGALWWAAQRNPHITGMTTWFHIGPLMVLIASAVLVAIIIHRRRVTLTDAVLKISAGLNTQTVAIDQLDLGNARIVDLDTHPDLRPWMKSMGTALPGLKDGHFRLRDGRKAFVLMTERHRLLVLPRRDGKLILLSMEKPQALLSALNELAAPAPRR